MSDIIGTRDRLNEPEADYSRVDAIHRHGRCQAPAAPDRLTTDALRARMAAEDRMILASRRGQACPFCGRRIRQTDRWLAHLRKCMP